jgi:hypothetical protein
MMPFIVNVKNIKSQLPILGGVKPCTIAASKGIIYKMLVFYFNETAFPF